MSRLTTCRTGALFVGQLPAPLEELLRQADSLIEQFRLARSTLRTYDQLWTVFTECVVGLGHRALPASSEAVAAFVVWVSSPVGEGGPGWSASYVDGILAAVADRHRQHGYDNPVAAVTTQARQDLRRVLLRQMPVVPTVAADVDELRTLLHLSLRRGHADALREVAVLAHLATGLHLEQLRAARPTLRGDALVLLAGEGEIQVRLCCDCSGDVRPRACMACAIQVLQAAPKGWRWSTTGWRDVERALKVLANTPPNDALIVGLCRPRALTFLRTRAWIVTAFDRGLRAQDLRDLQRCDIERVDQGWQLTLQRGKNDPFGDTAQFLVLPQEDVSVCPVQALSDWFAIRDGIAGPLQSAEGFAFCPTNRGAELSVESPMSREGDLTTWRRWRERAELSHLTQHGLRAGFMVTALQQGHSMEAINYNARHVRLETTTFGYVASSVALRQSQPSGGPR